MKIIVVDDDTAYATTGVKTLVERIGRDDVIVPLTRPAALPAALQQHPDAALVLVDLHFNNTNETGLTALSYLARNSTPPAVGFSAPQDDRLLYPYAACQLLPQPPIGWILKDDFDQEELVRIITDVGDGNQPAPSRTLKQYLPDRENTGDLMQCLLADKVDLEIWRMLSLRLHGDEEVGRKVYMSPRTVRDRYDRYRKAIVKLLAARDNALAGTGRDFGGLQREPAAVRHGWLRSWDPAGPELKKLSPFVGQFARLNSDFFHAPELDDLITKDCVPKIRNKRSSR